MDVCSQVLVASGMDQNGFKVGEQMMTGLDGGINSKLSTVLATIEKVMKAVIAKAEEVTEIASPSRVFMRIGRYLDEGLANGIKKYSNKAVDASGALSTRVVDTMSASISKISESIGGDVQYSPTIRPILDLSNVRNGF